MATWVPMSNGYTANGYSAADAAVPITAQTIQTDIVYTDVFHSGPNLPAFGQTTVGYPL